MNYFKKSLSRLLNGVLLAGSLLLAAGIAHARTNDLYVESVVMDDLKNIELNPGDPIRYTVSYGREAATGTDKHGEQRVRISVYLSTDGDPENNNNFLLDFFDDLFPKDATAADPRSLILTDRLPPNFTGTYFLLAKVRVTNGSADSAAADDIPSVVVTAAPRVTIRPYDSPTVSRISTSASGTESNELSESPSVSADGRYVVFQSEATNLVSTPTAPAGISQIYLRDTLTNEVKLISQLGGVAGNAESKFPVISSLGAVDPIAGSPRYYIAYQSSASNLVSGTGANDTNQQTDIFLYDLANATTTLISVPTGSPAGVQANGGSFLPSITGDGNLIAFESLASNLLGKGANGVLLDTNGKSDIYVYNRTTKAVTAASATTAGVLGNGDSTQARISENGSTVVFRSYAGNLSVGAAAPLPRSEILAKTLATGVSTGRIERISVLREAFGAVTRSFTALNRDAFDPAVSRDGRYVAFATRATNTTAPNGDTNDAGLSQVYVVNRAVNALPGAVLNPALDYDKAGNTSLNLVSTGISPLDPLPGFADEESVAPVISGDGRYIGFRTEASDLQPTTVKRSDGRVFQTKSSGVVGVIPDNTGVTVDMPVVTIKDGGGSGATAHAIVFNGQITSIVIDNAGSGYSATADPKLSVEITGGGGSGAQATATIGTVGDVTDAISGITLTRQGRGYASGEVVFTNGVGDGASGVATLTPDGGVQDVSVSTNGFGYNPQYTQIDFTDPDAPGGGVKPEAVPVIENGKIYDIVVISQGSGYLNPPAVSILSTPLVPASAQVTFENGKISQVDMLDSGAGYVSAPDVSIYVTDSAGTTSYPALAVISDGLIANAINSYSDINNTSDVYIRDTGIKSIIVTEGGSGYTSDILLDSNSITGGGGSSASALAVVEGGAITRIDLLNSGSGYLTEPTITLPDSPTTGGSKAKASAILTEGSERVSISQYGQETIGLIGGYEVPSSRSITMSSNGRYMLFTSEASNTSSFIFGKSNQIPLDLNKKRDIFVVDRKISQAVTPVLGTAPTVTISIDTRDLTFNSSRVISASAFDGGDVTISGDEQLPKDGVIKSIEIYANNIKIASNSAVGTSSTMLLDAVYTAPQVAGPTQLYAVTVDGNGNRVYSTPQIINVVAPQTQRPSVTLSSSTSTLTVGGTFVLSAIATDPENSIYSVSFYSNGLLLYTDTIPPYQYSYTPTYSGEYKLTAIVSDNDPALVVGQVGSQVRNDSISNEIVLRVLPPPSPTINISSPTDAVTPASLGQPVFLELNATTTNPAASISSVQIKDNGKLLPGIAQRQGLTASYRYTWYPTTTGLHTITAVATDSQQGTSESSSRDFTVSAIIGTAPVVDIISPAADALPILTQDIVNFQVRASDLGGTIRSTVIYGNGARLGSAILNAVTGYWELPVDASLLATGLYDFVAVSTDNDGNLVASPVRSLSVVISAPVVSIVTPALSSGVTVVDTKVDQPLVFIVKAFTRDSFSRVSNVTLSANGTSIGQAARIGNTDQYSFTWLPTTTGVFQIVASASDTKGGGAQTAELNIRVTELVGTAPTVQIDAPASTGGTNPIPASATMGSQVLFIATAFDNIAVTGVNFYADGVSIGAATRQGTTNQWVLNATLSGAPFSSKGVGSYAITAIASDADRNQTQSAVVTLNVTAAVSGTAPTGSLVFPAAASEQTLGQEVAMQALASDVDGAVASVAFYANGTLVGTDPTAPFTAAWTPTVAGAYNLVLVITDAQGATTVTAPVAVTVKQSSKPSVSLVSPAAATRLTVGSSLALEATASDADGTIASVGFYADGALVATGARVGNSTTYTATWSPALARSGAYKLTVKATDNVGQVTETAAVDVTVDAASGSAPVVQVTNPAAGGQNQAGASAALGSQVYLSANASDNLLVTGVNFYADGVSIGAATRQGTTNQWVLNATLSGAPFSSKGVGSYAITAIASDADRNQTQSAVVTLNVTAAVSGTAPTGSLVFPVTGDRFTTCDTIPMQALASDVDANVASVAFYMGGILVSTDTTAPYTAEVAAGDNIGQRQLVIVVTDTQGISYVSAATTITVAKSVPPLVSLLQPGAGASIRVGSAIPLAANASDTDGTISSVGFYADGALVATGSRLGSSDLYTATWLPAIAKNGYRITVKALDNCNNVTETAALSLNVDAASGSAPVVQVTNPAAGGQNQAGASAALGSQVYLSANASDNLLVTGVNFYADGVSIGAATRQGTTNQWVLNATLSGAPFSSKGVGSYAITAIASDADRNQTQSAVVTLNVTAAVSGTAPTGSLVFPAAASEQTLGQEVAMQALASDVDGAVASVAFYANGTLVGTDSTAPFTAAWTPTVAGAYNLVLVITDAQGATTVTAPVAVTVKQSSKPSVSLVSPAAATRLTVGSSLALEATASDADGTIASVGFYADGALVATGARVGNSTTYTATWSPALARSGAYKLTVKATDNVGQVTETAAVDVTVDAASGSAPVVQVTNPAAGGQNQAGASAALGSQVYLSANASDNLLVTGVNFYADGVSIGAATRQGTTNQWVLNATLSGAPFSSKGVGSYAITAIASDADRNQTQSAVVTLNVTAAVSGTAPTGSLVFPVTGDRFTTCDTIPMQALASDVDANVASVAFYMGGILVSTDTTAPYTAEVAAGDNIGQRQLVIVVTDTQGISYVSAATTITVAKSVPPLVSLLQPGAGASIRVGSAIPLAANASDTDGTISSVGFYADGALVATGSRLGSSDLYTATWLPAIAKNGYRITVKALDNCNNVTETAALSLNVDAASGSAPVVQVTNPAAGGQNQAGASAALGSQVYLSANASDNLLVTGVNFYADGVSIGAATRQGTTNQWVLNATLSGAPFSSKGVGSYAITAIASDADRNQTQSAVVTLNVTAAVSGTAPTGSLVFPAAASEQTLGQEVAMQALASDVDGAVASVAFYANGTLVGTDSTAPFTAAWTPTVAGAYNLVLVITDAQGATTVTAPVAVTVKQSSKPSVSLVSPAAATRLTVGSSLALEATASDADGTIASVGFYADGALVATGARVGNSTTYTATWSPALARSGAYKLTVKATDNVGQVTETAAVDVTVDAASGSAPVVQVTNPAAGGQNQAGASAALGSQVYLSANASDNLLVTGVNFYADGVSIGAATRQGTTNQWVLNATLSGAPFSSKGVGSYAITAIASDADRNQTQSAVVTLNVTAAVSGTAPTGSLVFPAAASEQTLGQEVAMQALASDVDGAVASVAFYANGTLVGTDSTAPFTAAWTPTVAGAYNLVLVITDAQGATTVTAPVAVTVNQSAAPSVSLVSPVVATTLTVGSNLALEATASDSDGTIASVGFYANGALVATGVQVGNSNSYTATWTPTVARSGAYKLTVKATDNVGLVTETSPGLNVTVNVAAGSAPTVQVTAPASGGGTTPTPATAALGSQVFFAANATDNIAVTAVNFYADGILIGAATQQGTTNRWVLVKSINGAPFSSKGEGTYAITAIASDADGNQRQSAAQSLSVTPASSAAAPTITLTGPSAGIINQTVLFSALPVAATTANVSRVEFFMNGVAVGSDTTAPYTLSYTGTVSGNYIVYAFVTDSLGNSVVSSAQSYTVSSATAPTITLTPSASSVTLGSTLTISAAAADADGTVDLVVFKEYYGSLSATPNRTVEDRIAPYSYVFNPTLTGTYLIVAEATDNQGNVTSSATQLITVLANAVIPVVSFNSPDAGSTLVVGQDTTLDVSVSVATGASVNQVNFYANGLLIGTGAQQGVLNRYRFVWQPSVTGVFTLSADAVDSFGGRGETSPTRTVSVINQTGSLPFVEIIQPVAPATTTGTNAATINTTSNSDLNLVASAVDSDGSISAVEFFLDRGRSAVATAGITFPSAIVNGAALQSTTGYINGITVTDAGAGYLSPPVVKIVGDGNGATAEAELTNGAISRIRITNKGAGYTNAIVRFEGGGLTNGLSMGQATRDFDSNSWRLATPYNFKSTGAGVYTFRAVARDNNNNVQTSAAVVVTVTPTPLNTPTSGTVVCTPATSPVSAVPAGQNVQLSISPSVVGGSVASVEFLANGVSIGTDTGSPYIINWIPAFVGNYNVLAVVTDSVGNKAVSAVLPVYVGGNIAPTITLIRPELSGSTGVVNQPVLLEAEAFAPTPGATISTVEFNADGVSLGIANQVGVSSRYVLSDWKPSTAKPYLITARVVDSFGQAALSSARTINVTVQSGVIPTVVLTAPSGGGTGGTTGGLSVSNNSGLFLSAQANDADGTVANVEFLVTRGQRAIARLGGTNSNDTGLYYGGIISISISSGGSGYLYAPRVKIIGSGVGASAEATVSNGAVTSIRILSPGTGYTSTSQILIEGGGLYENLVVGAATHNVGTLTWSSSIDLRSYDVGPYFFSARVTDNQGNTSISSTAAVTLNAATAGAPSVTLAVPASNLINLGQASKLVANPIAATSASIAKVDFFANGLLIGTATSSPYQYYYTAPSSGVYVIYAVVTDDTGNTSVSSAQTLTVLTAVPPVVSISAPSNTVALGSTLDISATATDADGTVTEVVFDITGAGTDSFADRNSPYVFEFKPTKAGIYSIRAQAKDNMGNTADSTPLSILVTPTSTKPTVEIISPVAGTTAVVGQSTTLEASVTVGNGVTVNQVNFYANGALIGPGAQQGQLNRYRVNWQPSVTGPFQLTAEVVDSYGVRGETTNARLVTVVAQTGALPSVQIIQPVTPSTTNGGTPSSLTTTANSDINLAASAMDSDGTINSVEFLLNRGRPATATATVKLPSAVVNGAALQQTTGTIGNITITDGGTGYLYPPQVSIVGDGNEATAVAEIQNGAVSTIRITSPGFGYTNASVRLVGGGFVENLSIGFAVRDFASDVWRLATPFNFKSYGAGFFTFRAVAKDNNNNAQSSDAVSVTVSSAPLTTPVTGNVVSTPVTSDVNGQRVPAGQSVQLALNPTVVGGSVASVEFFANGVSVGIDKSPPYIVNWVPSYVASYNVIAVVTDSVGNQGVSPASPVYVGGNIAPTIELIRPSIVGTTGVVNQAVLLEAEATALTPGATIATVEFNADGESVGIASQVGVSNRYVLSTWRPASAKTYNITARVVDSFGQAVLTSARAITVQTQTGVIPTVSLTAPANTGAGGTTGGGLTISNNSALFLSAQANDADGSVSKVEFLMSRGQQASAAFSDWSRIFYQSGYIITEGIVKVVSGGSGYLYPPRVKIVGNGIGATAEAVISNGAVTSVKIISLGSGYTYPPQFVFEGGGLYENLVVGSAVNAPGTLTWSTSLDLRNFDVGPYFFRARATDNSGNTVLSPATAVTVSEATASAPVVTLLAPTPATIDLGLTSNLVAIATPPVGVNITKVDFYANGTLVSTAPLAPYLLAFTAPSAGSYEIYAIVTDSAGNATLSQARTLVVKGLAPDATLSRIDRAYQAILDRSSTSAETKSALARNGVNLTSGQVAELVLQSSDYRDNQAELILSHLAVWGSYPNSSDYADLQAKKLALTVATDAGLIDAVLASASYKQRYGDIADLSITNTTQYNKVRDFAVRIYTNLYGKAPAKAATTNTVAKQFFSTISTGGTAGQAVVNFINANFGTVTNTSAGTGITDGTVILATNLQLNATIVARLRIAGAILLIGNEQPTAARINAFTGLSLAAVADYYFEGDTPFAAGTMVSIETSTESVAGTTYYASGLPKGLTMDRTTGVISGRLPSAVKAYAITYWSQNKGVRSASTTRILMVDALEAKFIGSNEALLVDADGLPAGKLTVKVASTADYTGTLVYRDGGTYSFKGVLSVVFDEDGVSTAFGEQSPIKRKAPLTALDVGLFFDADGALSTSLTEGDDVAPVASGDAIHVFTFTKAAPAPWQGSYKVGLLDVSDLPYFPDSAGSGTLSVANTGVLSVALVGKDGAKITGSVSGSLASDYRLYLRPYSKKPLGYFAGAVQFSDESTPSEVEFPVIGNDLTWFRPAGLAPITAGFGPLKIQLDYAAPVL